MVSRVADDSATPNDPSTGQDKAARTSQTETRTPASSNSAKSSTPKTTKPSPPMAKNPPTPKASGETRTPKKTTTRRRKTAPSKAARGSSIQTDLDRLEARLKRADGVTRKSVQSLETVVSALEAGLKKSTTSQKGRLTRHVNELTERLDQQTKDMRTAVRNELKAALAEGSLSDLDSALGRASLRLDKAEVSQADSIARVNKHLADIARAIDARMKAETQTRRAELDDVTEKLTTAITSSRLVVEDRVAAVERDSAAALNQVGDTIEKIHERLEQRRQSSNDMVVARVNELGLQTKAELNAYQTNLEARLAEMEARHLAVGTGAAERVVERAREDIRHRIDGLQQRISELENRPVEMAMPQMAPLPPLPDTQAPQNFSSQNTVPVTPERLHVTHVDETTAVPTMDAPPNPIQTLRDRLTSFRTPPISDNQNPYSAALRASNDAADRDDTLTLDKMAEAPTPYIPEPPQTIVPPSPVLPFPGQTANSGVGAPPLPPFQMPSALPPLTQADDFEPAPMPDPVYSNPAYAEGINARAAGMARSHHDSPMAVRVADDGSGRRFKLPSFENRNLRVGLLATGAVIVALLAGRVILGSGDGPNPNQIGGATQPIVTTEPITGTIPLTAVNTQTNPSFQPATPQDVTETLVTPDTSTDPIGSYAENQPVIIDAAELDTLEASVEAGNPIAQFLMGLAKLDAGQTDEGAALVRQSASANQPAALYRLAKLYEAGEGVPRDDVMARQLIERAARGGNRIAMHDLALYYTEGRGGVELSMSTAKSWFEQAARRGVVDSQFNLAILSESTEVGMTPNIEDALFWYAIAARQGDQFAVSRRDALRDTLSADQVESIDGRIAAFAPRAIDEEANGIFNNVPWVRTSQGPSRSQVREAQTLLASLGYQVGTPDGVMGARTRTAIVEFERASGLNETGRVSGALINRLANAAGA
jgi:localization factor PodJL